MAACEPVTRESVPTSESDTRESEPAPDSKGRKRVPSDRTRMFELPTLDQLHGMYNTETTSIFLTSLK